MSDTCKSIRDELPLWLTAELDDNRLTAIDTHVASCKDCAREAEAVRRLIGDITTTRDASSTVATSTDAASFFRERLAPHLEIVSRPVRMPHGYLRAAGFVLAFLGGAASVAAWQGRARDTRVDERPSHPPAVATTESQTPVSERLVDASAASGMARALRALAAMESRQR